MKKTKHLTTMAQYSPSYRKNVRNAIRDAIAVREAPNEKNVRIRKIIPFGANWVVMYEVDYIRHTQRRLAILSAGFATKSNLIVE